MVVPIIVGAAAAGGTAAAGGAAVAGTAAVAGSTAAAGGAAAGASAGSAAVGAEATAARSTLLMERQAAKQAAGGGANFSSNSAAQLQAQQSELSLDTASQWRAQGQRLRTAGNWNPQDFINRGISEETGIPEDALRAMQEQQQEQELQEDSRQSEEWNDPLIRARSKALGGLRDMQDFGKVLDSLPLDVNAMMSATAQGGTYMDAAWLDGGITGTTGSAFTVASFIYSIGVLPEGMTSVAKKTGLGKVLDMGSFYRNPGRYTSGCISLLIWFAGAAIILAILLIPVALIAGLVDLFSGGLITGTPPTPTELPQ